MKFGTALMALESGRKVTRKGWHGKGMFVYFVGPDRYVAKTDAAKSIADEEGKVSYSGYFAIKLPDGHVSVWTPSTEDLLADDWDLVEDDEHESSEKKPGEDHAKDIMDMFILGLLLHALEDGMNCDDCEKKDNCPIAKSSKKKEGKVNESGKTRSK